MDGFVNSISGMAREITNSVRINSDISKLENEKNQKYRCLGELYYNYSINGQDETFDDEGVIAQISEIHKRIDLQKAKLRKVKGSKQCPKCGTMISNDAQFCVNCGTKLEMSTRQCPTCGASITDDSIFCMQCGTKVDDVKTIVEIGRCSNCGEVLAPDAKFCLKCGAPVVEEPIIDSSVDIKTDGAEEL